MEKHSINQIIKVLKKLFDKQINTDKQIKAIQWKDLDKIDNTLTIAEKGLIMDFKTALCDDKVVEFLAGVNKREGEKK